MKYKQVLFDFDGTLANSFPWFMRNVNHAAERFGFRGILESEVEQLRGLHARSIIRHLGVPLWKVPAIAKFMHHQMSRDLQEIELFSGVEQLFDRLTRTGIVIGIVSSNSELNIRHVLGQKNSQLVRYYECGASLFAKHRRLKRLLSSSSVPPTRTIFIGDEIRDIEASRKAGVSAGVVTWGYTLSQSLRSEAPDEIFTNIEEMIERLCG